MDIEIVESFYDSVQLSPMKWSAGEKELKQSGEEGQLCTGLPRACRGTDDLRIIAKLSSLMENQSHAFHYVYCPLNCELLQHCQFPLTVGYISYMLNESRYKLNFFTLLETGTWDSLQKGMHVFLKV